MRRKNHGYGENTTQFIQSCLISAQPWQISRYLRRITHFMWSILKKGGVRRDLHVEKVVTWQKTGGIFYAQAGIWTRDGNQGGHQQQNRGREPETKPGVNSGGRRTWLASGLLLCQHSETALAHSWGAWVPPVVRATSAHPTPTNIICNFSISFLCGFATRNRRKLDKIMKSCEGWKNHSSAELILTLIKAWAGLFSLQKSWNALGWKGP